MSRNQAFRVARKEAKKTGESVCVCYGYDGNGRRTFYWYHGTAKEAMAESYFLTLLEVIDP